MEKTKTKPLINTIMDKIKNSSSPNDIRVGDFVEFRYPDKNGRHEYLSGQVISFTVTQDDLYFNILSWKKDRLYKMVSWTNIGSEKDFIVYPQQN